MKKEDQRIILTKRLLSDALLKLLKEKDIDKIKVTELCAAAEINRATFYRHYEQPGDVLNELKSVISTEIRILLTEGAAEGDTEKSLAILCRYCAERRELMKILLESGGDDDFARMLNEMYKANLSGAEQLQRQYNIDSEQLMLVSCYYVGGIYFIIRKWLNSENPIPPEELARIIYLVISGGISQGIKEL